MTVLLLLCLFMITACSAGGGEDARPVQAPPPPPASAPDETPTPATVLNWYFHGSLIDGGTVDGLVTYLKTAAVTGTNVRGLEPNTTYALLGWNLTVHQTTFVLQDVLFSSGPDAPVPGHGEFCLGVCIFSNLHMQRLYFTVGTNSLALLFVPPEGEGLSTALPQTLDEWAPFAVTLSQFRFTTDAENVWPITSGRLTVPFTP
jgi:hypothetical protein